MNKIAVYTCITGNYDNLKEINNVEKDIDYYCFTNNKNIKSNTWNVVYIEDKDLSNVELARRTKILGHDKINNYDVVLWMDGAVTFNKNIKDFINTYLKDNDTLVAFKHGERTKVHDEAVACYRFNKESKEKVKKLFKFYEKEKYPDNNGLIESTVYIKRPKDKKVQETMKLWFDMILNYTHRDQLSFNYCIYKTGLKVKWINKKVFDNEWFKWDNHNSNKEINNYCITLDDIKAYDIDKEIRGSFKVSNNNYLLEEKIPQDTETIYITISNISCFEYSNLKVKDVKDKDIFVYNNIDYKDNNIVYGDLFTIRIDKKYKKNEKLSLSINIDIFNEEEKDEVIKYLSLNSHKNKEKIEKLKSDCSSKQKYINNMWDFINSSFACKLVFKVKKKFSKNKYNI